jgi:hypothetical protein
LNSIRERDYEKALNDLNKYVELAGDNVYPDTFMIIGDIEETLRPKTPTLTPISSTDSAFPPGTEITIPQSSGIVFVVYNAPGSPLQATVCTVGTPATVLQAVTHTDGTNWVELDCDGGQGWVAEDALLSE